MSKGNENYRWVIAGVCFFLSFMVAGLGNSPLSLYIVPITEKLGFSRGDFSLVFTLVTFTTMLIQLVFGFFVNRFGVRALMIVGSILAPIGYFLFYLARTLPVFYAGGVILGCAFAFASITSISIIVHNWFHEKQGTVLGLIMAASGLGGFLFSRIIGKYIAQNGFQSSFLFSAILLAAATIPVILFTRSNPDDQNAAKSSTGGHAIGKISPGSFLKIRGMPVALLAVFLIGVVIHPVLVNTPAYLVEKGFDSVFAAGISAAIFFVLAVAKLGLGLIHDRLGIRISMILGLGSFILAALVLLFAASSWMVWVFVLFDGLAVATLSLLVPLFAKAILGMENYNSFLGVFIAILSAGISVGVPVISYAYDLMGTYTWVVAAFAVIGVLALGLAMVSLKQAGKPTKGGA